MSRESLFKTPEQRTTVTYYPQLDLLKKDIFASPWEFQSHRLFVIHQALIIERRFEDFSTPLGHVLHLFLPFCCIVSKGHWSSLPQKLPWLLSNITISSLNMFKRSLFQLLCTNIRQRFITFGANWKKSTLLTQARGNQNVWMWSVVVGHTSAVNLRPGDVAQRCVSGLFLLVKCPPPPQPPPLLPHPPPTPPPSFPFPFAHATQASNNVSGYLIYSLRVWVSCAWSNRPHDGYFKNEGETGTWVPEATRLLNLAAFGASLTSDLTLVSPANGRPDLASELPLVPRVRNRTNAISDLRVPYTLSDNRITQNYLAFSRITGNLKQDFTFTKKSKFEFTRTY